MNYGTTSQTITDIRPNQPENPKGDRVSPRQWADSMHIKQQVDGKTPGQVGCEAGLIAIAKANLMSKYDMTPWEIKDARDRSIDEASAAAVLAAFSPKVKPTPSFESVQGAISALEWGGRLLRTSADEDRLIAETVINLTAGTCYDPVAREELAKLKDDCANYKAQAKGLQEELQAMRDEYAQVKNALAKIRTLATR